MRLTTITFIMTAMAVVLVYLAEAKPSPMKARLAIAERKDKRKGNRTGNQRKTKAHRQLTGNNMGDSTGNSTGNGTGNSTGNGTVPNISVIVVLGLALNSDGSPKPELLERIDKAFAEANSRPEAKLVLTGHGGEAKVMAESLKKKGIDGERLLSEEKAKDTIQNAYYSLTLLDQTYALSQANKPVEIVLLSSDYHMPRASWIFRVMSEALKIKVKWTIVGVPSKDCKKNISVENGYVKEMPEQITSLMEEKGIQFGDIEDVKRYTKELSMLNC